jgi:hypothetical protein
MVFRLTLSTLSTTYLDTAKTVEYPLGTNRGTPQVQAWACGTRNRRILGYREFPICSTKLHKALIFSALCVYG